jgi:putative toxin-antitoxin system antitoxin component (TIGR02293 family)
MAPRHLAEYDRHMAMTEADRALAILGAKRVLPRVSRSGAVPPAIEPGEVGWIALIRAGLPSASLERTAHRLKLSVNELSRRLGLPPRTLHRRIQKGERLTPEETERNVRAARALARAQQILGDEDGRLWLLEPSRALGGEVPIMLLDTADGFTAVIDELGRLEYGVIS